MVDYLFNVALVGSTGILASLVILVSSFFFKKPISKYVRRASYLLLVIVLFVSATYHPLTYKNTTYDDNQRNYQDSLTSEEMNRRAQEEITLDGVMTPRETQKEREERTKTMLDWKLDYEQ